MVHGDEFETVEAFDFEATLVRAVEMKPADKQDIHPLEVLHWRFVQPHIHVEDSHNARVEEGVSLWAIVGLICKQHDVRMIFWIHTVLAASEVVGSPVEPEDFMPVGSFLPDYETCAVFKGIPTIRSFGFDICRDKHTGVFESLQDVIFQVVIEVLWEEMSA